MNNSILIIGDSGTGKSTSIRTLPHEETFIINVLGKQLPFRGSAKKYTKLRKDGKGNYLVTDNGKDIKKTIEWINLHRPDIKYLVLDDLGYVAMNAFMRRALLKGYDRFSEIASEFGDAIDLVNKLRDDLFCITTMHIETDRQGKTKPKTIGNMVDQYINIEGKFTYVFHTIVTEDSYKFLTKHDGIHMAKTPLDSFEKTYIDNDLFAITQEITNYLNEDITDEQATA